MTGDRAGRRKRRVISLVLSALFVLAAVFVFVNRQALHDQLILAYYEAPAEIAALATDSDLSDRGRDLFYVNEPELHGKATFDAKCSGVGDEQSNVLGCFTGTRIYIYDAADERLAGIEEVTAAHEMLHAAYIRLSRGERERVESLLERQLDDGIAPHVDELIEIYERIEPDQLLNEMHSILATEQAELLPELETYYSQYFKDRKVVVGLATDYREAFDSLKREQEALVAELEELSTTINNTTELINQQLERYNASVEDFNARAESGEMTAEQFNSERPVLENERLAINQAINSNNILRQTYEEKRKQYESLAIEFNSLQTSISSKPIAPRDIE